MFVQVLDASLQHKVLFVLLQWPPVKLFSLRSVAPRQGQSMDLAKKLNLESGGAQRESGRKSITAFLFSFSTLRGNLNPWENQVVRHANAPQKNQFCFIFKVTYMVKPQMTVFFSQLNTNKTEWKWLAIQLSIIINKEIQETTASIMRVNLKSSNQMTDKPTDKFKHTAKLFTWLFKQNLIFLSKYNEVCK